MEFARVASERGHKVTLYEKEKELGGRFKLAAKPPKKGEIAEFIDYLSRSLAVSGVDIRTETCVEPEQLLQAGAFDEVVVAVGGEPISLPMAQASPRCLCGRCFARQSQIGRESGRGWRRNGGV